MSRHCFSALLTSVDVATLSSCPDIATILCSDVATLLGSHLLMLRHSSHDALQH